MSGHQRYSAVRNFRFRYLSVEAKLNYKVYERLQCVIRKDRVRRRFLINCLEEQVIPPSFKIDIKHDFEAFHEIKKLFLKDRIHSIKLEIEESYRKARRAYNNLRFFVDPYTIQTLLDYAHSCARRQEKFTKALLHRKLCHLMRYSVWERYSMTHNIINLSSTTLTHDEKVVLGLGLSFNIKPSDKDFIPIVASFDKFFYLNRDKIEDPDTFRGIISPLLLAISQESSHLPRRLVRALEQLRRRRDIRVMPADKGGKIVIMNSDHYDSKVNEILSDQETYQKLASNPLEEHNIFIRSRIRELAAQCPEPQLIEKFQPKNCTLPYFYGIPKAHKVNIPLRPIISSIGSVTSPIAGWLASILSAYLGKFSNSHLKNSYEFKSRMQEFSAIHSTNIIDLVSLDVVSLFTKVPIDDVIAFLGRKIDSGEITIPIPKQPFLELIKLCVMHNVFEYQGKFYKQKFGISMGSPLSPVLANLYMEYFESELLPNISQDIPLWVRYVDDILLAWPHGSNFKSFFTK